MYAHQPYKMMTNTPIHNLDQADWASKALNDPNAIILDVRTQEECASGIIPGAIVQDIMKGQGFIYAIEELDKDVPYYVYCRSGNRSGQACRMMQELGFKQTYNLVGGMMSWQGEVVKPVEQ